MQCAAILTSLMSIRSSHLKMSGPSSFSALMREREERARREGKRRGEGGGEGKERREEGEWRE